MVNVSFICNGNDIEDKQVNKEYIDHKNYKGIGLMKAEKLDSVCYVFYRLMHNNGDWIRVLKVSNPEMFSKYCHEITWHIFEKEIYNTCDIVEKIADILKRSQDRLWIAIECEKRFLTGYPINHPLFNDVRYKRMYRNNIESDLKNMDFLYTEYAFLN